MNLNFKKYLFPSFKPDAEPCIEHDLITGCVVRNLNMFSLVSNSSKECCKNFQSIAAGIDLEALQSSLVVIEFNMTKVIVFLIIVYFLRCIITHRMGGLCTPIQCGISGFHCVTLDG